MFVRRKLQPIFASFLILHAFHAVCISCFPVRTKQPPPALPLGDSFCGGRNRFSGSPYPCSQGPVRSLLTVNLEPSGTNINHLKTSGTGESVYPLNNGWKLFLATLQGVDARRSPSPSLWLNEASQEPWLRSMETLGVQVNESLANDPAGVAQVVKQSLGIGNACIAVDSQQSDSVTCSLVASGALGVPAVDEAATGISCSGESVAADCTGAFAHATADKYRGSGLLSPRITTVQDPNKSEFVSGFSVFSAANTQWQDKASSLSLQGMKSGFAAFGWGPDELGTVTDVSRLGGWMHASDFCLNLAVQANIEPSVPPMPPQHLVSPQKVSGSTARHTVTFVMSDGDNLQWLLGSALSDEKHFGSPLRGTVPVAWTMSSAMAELAPAALSVYYNSATSMDSFVSAPSGAGYFYPDQVPPQDLDGTWDASVSLACKAGHRLLTVIGGDDCSADQLARPLNSPEIDGMIYWNFSRYDGMNGRVQWVNGKRASDASGHATSSMPPKPIVGARYQLWSGFYNSTSLSAAINHQGARDVHSVDGYSLVVVHVWSMGMQDVVDTIKGFDDDIDVVSVGEFFDRMTKHAAPKGQGQVMQRSSLENK